MSQKSQTPQIYWKVGQDLPAPATPLGGHEDSWGGTGTPADKAFFSPPHPGTPIPPPPGSTLPKELSILNEGGAFTPQHPI